MMDMSSVFLMFTGFIVVLTIVAGVIGLAIFRLSLAYRQQFAEERALERSMEKHMQIAAKREQRRQKIRAERRAARSSMAHA
ncbi:hypothetical protein [Neorhizobium alkalisoli]|uniref:Uncharacterized protein n=1 Tax=Neorhizobium alkalisoli TaxID=528178 RepID=A0A561R3G6_9HYPH|nr:hypothetical protein [Neorhizobium alkalisoli]TWF57147.1 hypothetical protein FHW37_102788 [Neorhizobium alkalisoli]